MLNRKAATMGVAGALCCIVSLGAGSADDRANQAGNPADLQGQPSMQALQVQFLSQHPGTHISYHPGSSRVYGKSFSSGVTPVASAEKFKNQWMPMFGTSASELVAKADHLPQGNTIPLMADPVTGEAKFTAIYYGQERGGLPVFGARTTMLVRNEPGFPLVLVNPDVRVLGDFEVDQVLAADAGFSPLAQQAALARYGADAHIESTRKVIWAGLDDAPVQPTLADESVVINSPEKWLLLTDAATGEVLFEESLILFHGGGVVAGNASGFVTDGLGSEQCEPEVLKGLPYMQVSSGFDVTFTDANGDFVIPSGGPVQASLNGMWFDIFNFLGGVESESAPGTTPADLTFNSANNDEEVRSQINAYRESNVIRDFVLQYSPSYPTLQNQNFPVTVNRTDGFCPGNAWYDPVDESINFCLSGSSNPNTAWTSVIYHEYGHHLVNAGGSGQGQYGEGMGDVMSVLILDSHLLGLGFFNNCSQPLRDPVANFRSYPCNGGIHDCGQLISGCVWDTRNELVITNPTDYIDILANLAINSILLHSGSTISPDITIDYLTLDDNNGNIMDGTPHYQQIATGFGAHNMDAPELSVLAINFPNGQPSFVAPTGGTTIEFDVVPVVGQPEPGAARAYVDAGSGFVEAAVSNLGGNSYEATFPATDCGTAVSYYFEADSTSSFTISSPPNAPSDSYSVIAANGIAGVSIDDDFESNLGWNVSSSLGDGPWEREVPLNDNCNRGAPTSDADGSGTCYLTDNTNSTCNSDVDDGSTTLTSPVLDASSPESILSYHRWYSNTEGDNPQQDIFVVEVSDNAGLSWVNLETVGPGGSEVDGGWFYKEFVVSEIAGISNTNQFQIRFIASDTNPQSVVEAAVDGVRLIQLDCEVVAPPCAGNANDDSIVDVFDLLAILDAFGPCPGCPEDLNDDNVVDVFDLLDVLDNFGPCP